MLDEWIFIYIYRERDKLLSFVETLPYAQPIIALLHHIDKGEYQAIDKVADNMAGHVLSENIKLTLDQLIRELENVGLKPRSEI